MDVKELCRLCANKNSVCKDLLHADNKGLLKLTQEFIQIVVYENDNLPSSICINCEEKMVSFQLFVLECLDAQEVLRRTFLDNVQCTQIKKEEHSILDYIPPVIKSEVKDEIIREELCAEEIGVPSGNVPSVYEDNSDADPDFLLDDDYLSDDLSIAALKQRKDTEVKNRVPTEEDLKNLQELSIKRDLKVHNFVKLECTTCNEKFPSWTALYFHFYKIHKQKAVAFCLCGLAIKSKNALYKHFNEHKSEFRKINKNMQKENEESRSSGVKVSDYVKFICPECSKDFSSWYTLKTHCERKHRIMPFVKCKCGVTLKSKSVMYKHVGDHKSPDIFTCDKCPRITKSLSALNKHKMRHVPKTERRFSCAMCDKIFNSKEGLKSHEKSHIPIEDRKVFRCDKCDMKFTTRSSAASHRRVVHDKIKSYVCDLCGYSCGTNGELRQHRAIHSDDKPFVCKICPKTFKTYSNLKTHEDTHENTSYQCHKCRRVLNSRRTLRKHLLVHQDECRHVCCYCLKAFKRRQTLTVHMHTHTGDKPLACQWCSERFAYASTLRSHRLRCHPDKMAARPTNNYSTFQHAPMQQNFVKNNLSTAEPPVSKNEVESI